MMDEWGHTGTEIVVCFSLQNFALAWMHLTSTMYAELTWPAVLDVVVQYCTDEAETQQNKKSKVGGHRL